MSIIAVWGSPQSGKTEVAVALSKMLSRRYGKVVCLISAQDYAEMANKLNVFDIMGRGLIPAITSDKTVNKNAIEVEKEKGLFLIGATPTDSALDLVFTRDQALRLLNGASMYFQHVIVDCTTTKNNAITGEAVALCDKVVIPYTGKIDTKYWHDANESILSKLRSKALYVRCSTVKAFDYLSLEAALDVKPICTIPYCKSMPDLVSNGMGLLDGGRAMCDSVNSLALEVVNV